MIVAGIVVGVAVGLALGLTGAGGSVLAVPLLVFVLDLRVPDAMGVSLGAVSAAAMVGALLRRRQGDAPHWQTALALASTGMLCAPVGRYLAYLVDERIIVVLFSALAAYVALRMWRRASTSDESEPCPVDRSAPEPGLWGSLLLAGAGVGLLSGFFGVGGGFLIVPLLRLRTGMPMAAAISTSLLVIALVGSSGYLYHVLTTQSMQVSVLPVIALGSIVGILAGTAVSRRLSGARLEQLFAVCVLVTTAYLLVGTLL